jgi:hypothetical protein
VSVERPPLPAHLRATIVETFARLVVKQLREDGVVDARLEVEATTASDATRARELKYGQRGPDP